MITPAFVHARRRRTLAARHHALRPFARFTPVLVVPGLHDSGPEHWQSLWLSQHPSFVRVVQADFATPALDQWAATVARAIDAAGAPPIIVAHSFGCLATVRAAFVHRRAIAGALLVAPADPDRFGVGRQLPSARLPFPSTLVGSTDDPWLKFVKAGALASRWGSRFEGYANVGHINADSGLGAWPAGFALLRDLAERAASAGTLAPTARAA
jgi:predicted alpha/beta hydrolase family esterase